MWCCDCFRAHLVLFAMQLLLNKGADPNTTEDDGNTPLHLAASTACDDIVEVGDVVLSVGRF